MPGTNSFDLMPVLFWIIGGLIVVVFIVVIVSTVMNAARVRKAGHNPMTLQADIATKLLDSDILAAEPTVEARLAKLDSLAAARTITAEEHASARARLLAEL